MPLQEDCVTCRVVGGVTLTGTGLYALWNTRSHVPGNPMGKRLIGMMGAGFVAIGILRLLPMERYLEAKFGSRKASVESQ